MTREAINKLKKYTLGKKNTEKVEISVLQLNRIIKTLEREPCEDAISRQAVLDEMYKRKADGDTITAGFIKNLPSVNPQPKIGRWIAYEVGLPDRTILNYRCSVCGRKLIGYNTETLSEVPFCHCGAKMQAESKG